MFSKTILFESPAFRGTHLVGRAQSPVFCVTDRSGSAKSPAFGDPSTPESLKAGLFELPPNPEGLKARHLAPRRWAHACLDVFIIKFYLMTHNTRCIEINIFCLRLQRYNNFSRFASLPQHFNDETPYFPDEPPHFYIFLNIVCLQTAKKRGAR